MFLYSCFSQGIEVGLIVMKMLTKIDNKLKYNLATFAMQKVYGWSKIDGFTVWMWSCCYQFAIMILYFWIISRLSNSNMLLLFFQVPWTTLKSDAIKLVCKIIFYFEFCMSFIFIFKILIETILSLFWLALLVISGTRPGGSGDGSIRSCKRKS